MRRFVVQLPPDATSVRVGRHAARDTLLEWGLGHLVDDVQLAVSELVANAVRHTGVDVELVLEAADQLRVSVSDQHPLMLAGRSNGENLPETGRGLRIVAAVSTDWGVESYGEGKQVWCCFSLSQQRGDGASVHDLVQHHVPELRPVTGQGSVSDAG